MEITWAWVLAHWLEWAFGIIASVFAIMYKRLTKKVKQNKTEQDAIKSGIRALLKNEIKEQYERWNEMGYCPIDGRENIRDMYDAYHGLGGNGTVTNLIDKLADLPINRKEC